MYWKKLSFAAVYIFTVWKHVKREEDKTEEIISRLAASIFSTYAYTLNQMMIVVNDKRNFKYV